MKEPRWLTRAMIDAIHSKLIQEHGGSTGIREGGSALIDSALARPLNKFAYQPDIDSADLAAAYLFGLAKNHGYVDGNKRIGFAAAVTFLLLNGMKLKASQDEAYDSVIAVVEGRLSEEEAAIWLRKNSTFETEAED
jgi:death-on-curing protein